MLRRLFTAKPFYYIAEMILDYLTLETALNLICVFGFKAEYSEAKENLQKRIKEFYIEKAELYNNVRVMTKFHKHSKEDTVEFLNYHFFWKLPLNQKKTISFDV